MPMRIRFALHGLKHRQVMHLVATNSRARRDGKPAELLGIYNPFVGDSKHKMVQWSVDRIKYWLSVGAVPSKSVVKLLETGNVLEPNSKYHPKSRPTRDFVAKPLMPRPPVGAGSKIAPADAVKLSKEVEDATTILQAAQAQAEVEARELAKARVLAAKINAEAQSSTSETATQPTASGNANTAVKAKAGTTGTVSEGTKKFKNTSETPKKPRN